MEQIFPIMTEEYRQTHYKDGVFAQMHKNTAKVSFLVYLFMGAVFAAGAYGFWWTLSHLEAFREADLTVFSYAMAAFCALFAFIGLACLVISVRRQLRGPEKWKELCAQENGYTVSDMDAFERQALELESRVLCLVDPLKKTVQGQEDGILTRDYIALSLNSPSVLKLSDLTAACLYTQTIKASGMPIEYLNIGLMGKNGTSVAAECSKKTGPALLALLKDRVPGLDTANDKILDSSEYDDLFATKFGKKKKPAKV